jgi:DNA-binding MarR family transcriptional regulator
MAGRTNQELMRAWARIVRVKQTLEGAIERELKDAGALPLAWYDVLLELERAPEGRLPPRDLEQEILIAQYNLSRLLDRLEREGLVRRRDYPGDARRQLVEITALGRKRRAESWPVYSAAVERHAGQRLSASELRRLLELLGRFLPETQPDQRQRETA